MVSKKLSILCLLIFGLIVLIAASPLSPLIGKTDTPDSDGLIPHRASYKIEMISRESGSQVLNVSGKMSYEWRPDCDGWTTDHIFELYYEYTDSIPVKINSRFSTYETYDGTLFSFNVRRRRNGQLYEELRGRATDKNNEHIAVYTKPAGLTINLPAGTLFPTAHTREMVEKINAGDKFFNAVVFDGSDDEGPVEINSFIGRPANARDKVTVTDAIDMTLLKTPARKIRMAFFPVFETAAESDYEMDALFHKNGVISHIEVEYQDFSVRQSLTKLEKIDIDPACDNKADPDIKL